MRLVRKVEDEDASRWPKEEGKKVREGWRETKMSETVEDGRRKARNE